MFLETTSDTFTWHSALEIILGRNLGIWLNSKRRNYEKIINGMP